MQCQCRLAGGFRSEDLDDSSLGVAADAKCRIQCQASRRNGVHAYIRPVAKTHDGAFSVLLLNRLERILQQLVLAAVASRLYFCFFFCHIS